MTAPDLDALGEIRTIDITTIGRQSGAPARIEIWWFRFDGRFFIAGTPGPRDWLANLIAQPAFTVHAGGHDLPATARVVDDRDLRRRFFTGPETSWYQTQTELEDLVDRAPLIEVIIDQAETDR